MKNFYMKLELGTMITTAYTFLLVIVYLMSQTLSLSGFVAVLMIYALGKTMRSRKIKCDKNEWK